MMQEQNKVLANASIQYLAAFTNALHLQAAQRQDQIDPDFIKAAFGEMKRSFVLIEQFQKAHVKTMDAAMQAKVKMMMERMNRNLAGLKENLDFLEKEIQGGQNLHVIASRTGEMLKYLDELSQMRAAQGGRSTPPLNEEVKYSLNGSYPNPFDFLHRPDFRESGQSVSIRPGQVAEDARK